MRLHALSGSSVARRAAGGGAEPVSESAGRQPGVRDHPRPGLASVRAGRHRRARSASGRRCGCRCRSTDGSRACSISAASRPAATAKPTCRSRGASPTTSRWRCRTRRSPTRRSARRRWPSAPPACNALEGLLSTLTERARRAPGRRSRVGDRADGVAARCAVHSAAHRGRRSRARLRQQRPRRQRRRRTRRSIPDLTLLTRPWEFQIFDDLRHRAALHLRAADQGRDAIGADDADQDRPGS